MRSRWASPRKAGSLVARGSGQVAGWSEFVRVSRLFLKEGLATNFVREKLSAEQYRAPRCPFTIRQPKGVEGKCEGQPPHPGEGLEEASEASGMRAVAGRSLLDHRAGSFSVLPGKALLLGRGGCTEP